MRVFLLGGCVVLIASCGPRGAPAAPEPRPARAPVEHAATTPDPTPDRPFPPLTTIAAPSVRAWAGPAMVIRAPAPATAAVPATPDRTATIRAGMDKELNAWEPLARVDLSFEVQTRLADLYQRRAAVSDPADAIQFRGQALAVLRAVVTNPGNRNAPGFDRALLQYGTLLFETDAVAGRKAMLDLVKWFPRSPQVAHVYLHFGEHYFGLNDLSKANQFYRKVLALNLPETRDYARYKLAWVEFNLGNGAEAVSALMAVLRSAAPDDAAMRLRAEARKDLPRFYAQVGAVDKAREFFARVVPGHEIDSLDRLADGYEDMGKYVEARVIYAELSTLAPADARQCVWLQGESRSAEALGDHGAVIDASSRLIAAPGCRADPAVRATVGQLARRVHLEAIATGDRATLQRAVTLYGAYLAGAADATDAGLVAYYRAHLRWSDAMTLRDPDRAIEAWRGLAAECAKAVSSGLDRAEATGAADCALAALENTVAIAGTFERLTPALAAQLAVELEAVAIASGTSDRVGALRQRLQQ